MSANVCISALANIPTRKQLCIDTLGIGIAWGRLVLQWLEFAISMQIFFLSANMNYYVDFPS